jgi:hypothetical protein
MSYSRQLLHAIIISCLFRKTLIDRDKQEKQRLETKGTTRLKLKGQKFSGGNVKYVQYKFTHNQATVPDQDHLF